MGWVKKSAVSVRFSGDDLDPPELTRALGVAPDISYCKGEPVGAGRGTGRTGLWSFAVPTASPGDLDGQILRLFDAVSPDLAVWNALSGKYQEGELFVGLWLSQGNEGIGLALHTMRSLAERGLRVDFDIYAVG